MAFKSLYEAKVVKIHVLGRAADGDLKRPFSSGAGLFGGASPLLSLSPHHLTTHTIQPPRIRKQTRLPSKKLKNALARKRSDRATRRRRGIYCLHADGGEPLERDIYYYAYIRTAHTRTSYVPVRLDVAKMSVRAHILSAFIDRVSGLKASCT